MQDSAINSKINIVIIPAGNWSFHEATDFYSRNGAFIKVLSGHKAVKKLLIVSPLNLYGFLSSWRNYFFRRNMNSIQRKILKVGRNFVLFQVLNKNTFVLETEVKHLESNIRKAISLLDISNFVLWIGSPLYTYNYKKLSEKLSIFDAMDYWNLAPEKHIYRTTINKGYDNVANKADVILCVSKEIESYFKSIQHDDKDIFLIPNGIDTALFLKKEYPETIERDSVIENIKREQIPTVGYIGTLHERIDINLLRFTCETLQNINFIFIGPIISSDKSYFDKLRALNNVHFLGRKHHSTMPHFLACCDVCMIPHVENKYTKSQGILKLYEYLAMGKPIVSTNVPPADELAKLGLVYLARNKEEFVYRIIEAIKERDELIKDKRRCYALECSWDKRVNSIINIFRSKL